MFGSKFHSLFHHRRVYPIWNDCVGNNIVITIPLMFLVGATWVMAIFPIPFHFSGDLGEAFCISMIASVIGGYAIGLAISERDSRFSYVVNHVFDAQGTIARPKMWLIATFFATPIGCLAWCILRKIPVTRIQLEVLIVECNLPRYDRDEVRWITERG